MIHYEIARRVPLAPELPSAFEGLLSVCSVISVVITTETTEIAEMKIWPGTPYPLGATYDGSGTNFSLFSEAAERVELCLFDDHGNQACVDLAEMTGFIWHGYLPDVSPG